MTQISQDELLARINELSIIDELDLTEEYLAVKALRAVVDLCNFLDKKGHCCVPVKEVIQAIEKELG